MPILKIFKRRIALVTLTAFFVTQFQFYPVANAAVQPVTEVKPSAAWNLSISPDLGTIETLSDGKGPALLHVQTAHGHYGAEKKIAAILKSLQKQYGINAVFVEGSAFKLRPELLRLYPDAKKNAAIADALAKKALVKAPELFLLDNQKAVGYGIEEAALYRKNLEVFKKVLTQGEETGTFVRDLDLQIERLTSPLLSKPLRDFLKRLESFEAQQISMTDWLSFLREKAREHLSQDPADPSLQIQWPMLVRVFRLMEAEKKLDLAAFAGEKEEFKKALRRFLLVRWPSLINEVEQFLDQPLSRHQLPDPGTSKLFEEMVSALPDNFAYGKFPNVCLFIGHLILQSELKAGLLWDEIEKMGETISLALAQTPEEKEILSFLKAHRMLHKLFRLELLPSDYEKILKTPETFKPSMLSKRLLDINPSVRVKNAEFHHLSEIDRLFGDSLEFYRLARERDGVMAKNILARMQKDGIKKAAVVTGGFHARPFQDFFESKNFRYALISPKITSDENSRQNYLESILHHDVSSANLNSVPSYGQNFAELRKLGQKRADFLFFSRALASVSNVTIAKSWEAAAAGLRSELRNEIGSEAEVAAKLTDQLATKRDQLLANPTAQMLAFEEAMDLFKNTITPKLAEGVELVYSPEIAPLEFVIKGPGKQGPVNHRRFTIQFVAEPALKVQVLSYGFGIFLTTDVANTQAELTAKVVPLIERFREALKSQGQEAAWFKVNEAQKPEAARSELRFFGSSIVSFFWPSPAAPVDVKKLYEEGKLIFTGKEEPPTYEKWVAGILTDTKQRQAFEEKLFRRFIDAVHAFDLFKNWQYQTKDGKAESASWELLLLHEDSIAGLKRNGFFNSNEHEALVREFMLEKKPDGTWAPIMSSKEAAGDKQYEAMLERAKEIIRLAIEKIRKDFERIDAPKSNSEAKLNVEGYSPDFSTRTMASISFETRKLFGDTIRNLIKNNISTILFSLAVMFFSIFISGKWVALPPALFYSVAVLLVLAALYYPAEMLVKFNLSDAEKKYKTLYTNAFDAALLRIDLNQQKKDYADQMAALQRGVNDLRTRAAAPLPWWNFWTRVSLWLDYGGRDQVIKAVTNTVLKLAAEKHFHSRIFSLNLDFAELAANPKFKLDEEVPLLALLKETYEVNPEGFDEKLKEWEDTQKSWFSWILDLLTLGLLRRIKTAQKLHDLGIKAKKISVLTYRTPLVEAKTEEIMGKSNKNAGSAARGSKEEYIVTHWRSLGRKEFDPLLNEHLRTALINDNKLSPDDIRRMTTAFLLLGSKKRLTELKTMQQKGEEPNAVLEEAVNYAVEHVWIDSIKQILRQRKDLNASEEEISDWTALLRDARMQVRPPAEELKDLMDELLAEDPGFYNEALAEIRSFFEVKKKENSQEVAAFDLKTLIENSPRKKRLEDLLRKHPVLGRRMAGVIHEAYLLARKYVSVYGSSAYASSPKGDPQFLDASQHPGLAATIRQFFNPDEEEAKVPANDAVKAVFEYIHVLNDDGTPKTFKINVLHLKSVQAFVNGPEDMDDQSVRDDLKKFFVTILKAKRAVDLHPDLAVFADKTLELLKKYKKTTKYSPEWTQFRDQLKTYVLFNPLEAPWRYLIQSAANYKTLDGQPAGEARTQFLIDLQIKMMAGEVIFLSAPGFFAGLGTEGATQEENDKELEEYLAKHPEIDAYLNKRFKGFKGAGGIITLAEKRGLLKLQLLLLWTHTYWSRDNERNPLWKMNFTGLATTGDKDNVELDWPFIKAAVLQLGYFQEHGDVLYVADRALRLPDGQGSMNDVFTIPGFGNLDFAQQPVEAVVRSEMREGKKTADIEAAVQKTGREIFARAEHQSTARLKRQTSLSEHMIRFTSNDDYTKVKLLHFIGLLSNVGNNPEYIFQGLRQYFPWEDTKISFLVRLGAQIALFIGWLFPSFVANAILWSINAFIARRFFAGENLEEALQNIRGLHRRGLGVTVDVLGEKVLSPEGTKAYLKAYEDLLAPGVVENISIKLSSLYSEFNSAAPELAKKEVKKGLRQIVQKVKENPVTRKGEPIFITLDMEEYKDKDLIIEIFKEVAAEEKFYNFGLAIQAYIRDETLDVDLPGLAEFGKQNNFKPAIRLVKGAYWDQEVSTALRNGWEVPLFENKPETDVNYENAVDLLFDNIDNVYPAFATHNIRSMAVVIAQARARGISPDKFEFQCLYGMIPDEVVIALKQMGYKVRIYTPYGELLPGLAYLVRRILETSANGSFLKELSFDKKAIAEQLKDPRTKTVKPRAATAEQPLEMTLEIKDRAQKLESFGKALDRELDSKLASETVASYLAARENLERKAAAAVQSVPGESNRYRYIPRGQGLVLIENTELTEAEVLEMIVAPLAAGNDVIVSLPDEFIDIKEGIENTLIKAGMVGAVKFADESRTLSNQLAERPEITWISLHASQDMQVFREAELRGIIYKRKDLEKQKTPKKLITGVTPDYLLQFLMGKSESKNTIAMGFAPSLTIDGGQPGYSLEPPVQLFRPENQRKMKEALEETNRLLRVGSEIPLIINGKKRFKNDRMDSLDPSNGKPLSEISKAGIGDADDAVAAAKAASPSWQQKSTEQRAAYLKEAAKIMAEQKFLLAAIMVREVGKNWRESLADVDEAIDFLNYYAANAVSIEKEDQALAQTDRWKDYKRVPNGITAVIAPWNFPLAILTGMAAGALVTGNTVIMKPAEQSSIIAYKLMEIFQKARIPAGVVNFLPGKGEVVGERLVVHEDVDTIAFTGSKEVGFEIINAASKVQREGKPAKTVIAEMGGKNAVIVDASADLDQAVDGVIAGFLSFAGQKCSAGSRVIVLPEVWESFRTKLVAKFNSIIFDSPDKPETFVGPVIDADAKKKIGSYKRIAQKEGLRILARRTLDGLDPNGFYVAPVIYDDVPETSRLAYEEIFGPVLVVMRAKDIDDAFRIANNTPYGLTGAIYSRVPSVEEAFRNRVLVGNIYVDRPPVGALVGRQPFGGYGHSGIGSKAGGPEYLHQFMHWKRQMAARSEVREPGTEEAYKLAHEFKGKILPYHLFLLAQGNFTAMKTFLRLMERLGLHPAEAQAITDFSAGAVETVFGSGSEIGLTAKGLGVASRAVSGQPLSGRVAVDQDLLLKLSPKTLSLLLRHMQALGVEMGVVLSAGETGQSFRQVLFSRLNNRRSGLSDAAERKALIDWIESGKALRLIQPDDSALSSYADEHQGGVVFLGFETLRQITSGVQIAFDRKTSAPDMQIAAGLIPLLLPAASSIRGLKRGQHEALREFVARQLSLGNLVMRGNSLQFESLQAVAQALKTAALMATQA